MTGDDWLYQPGQLTFLIPGAGLWFNQTLIDYVRRVWREELCLVIGTSAGVISNNWRPTLVVTSDGRLLWTSEHYLRQV